MHLLALMDGQPKNLDVEIEKIRATRIMKNNEEHQIAVREIRFYDFVCHEEVMDELVDLLPDKDSKPHFLKWDLVRKFVGMFTGLKPLNRKGENKINRDVNHPTPLNCVLFGVAKDDKLGGVEQL